MSNKMTTKTEAVGASRDGVSRRGFITTVVTGGVVVATTQASADMIGNAEASTQAQPGSGPESDIERVLRKYGSEFGKLKRVEKITL